MIHISIEGMDGVGKSTICKELSKHLNYRFVEKPLHYLFSNPKDITLYQQISKRVNQNEDRTFTAWYYGLNNIYLYTLFSNENIITDRHIVSNYCWSGTADNEDIYDMILSKIGKPSLTVILYATPEVIRSRLIQRNPKDGDLKKVLQAEENYKKMLYFCEKKKLPFIQIDTSHLSKNQVVETILEKIKELKL